MLHNVRVVLGKQLNHGVGVSIGLISRHDFLQDLQLLDRHLFNPIANINLIGKCALDGCRIGLFFHHVAQELLNATPWYCLIIIIIFASTSTFALNCKY